MYFSLKVNLLTFYRFQLFIKSVKSYVNGKILKQEKTINGAVYIGCKQVDLAKNSKAKLKIMKRCKILSMNKRKSQKLLSLYRNLSCVWSHHYTVLITTFTSYRNSSNSQDSLP